MEGHPLEPFILAAVPLYIMQLEAQDGPTDYQVEQARIRGIANADHMLCRNEYPGEAAELADCLAEVIAILSFAPGGIELFGHRFKGKVTMDMVTIRIWESTRSKIQLLANLHEVKQVQALDDLVTQALKDFKEAHPGRAERIDLELNKKES